MKINQNTANIGMNFFMSLDSRLGWTFFKVRKLVPRSAWSQSWLCPFMLWNTTSTYEQKYRNTITQESEIRFVFLPACQVFEFLHIYFWFCSWSTSLCVLEFIFLTTSMAEWSERRTRSLTFLGSSTTLTTTWNCFMVSPTSNPGPC